MQTADLSLRERQRLETLERLHVAAAELAEADGLAATTVDAIAERAGVSRRTFFNYYAGKEDAVLGLIGPSIPSEILDEAADAGSSDDDLRRAVHLLTLTARASRLTVGGSARRRQLIDQMPELGDRIKRQTQQIQDLVLEALTSPDSELGDHVAGSIERARALVLLAAAVMRYAYDTDPRILEDEDLSALDSSISTFRNLLKED